MLRTICLPLVALMLAGCGPTQAEREATAAEARRSAEREKQLQRQKQQREQSIREMMAVVREIEAEQRTMAAPAPDNEDAPEPLAARPEAAEREPVPDLCWQDYCPCEPPQGGPDEGICRHLRAGMQLDAETLSAAAMMRDGREQLREWEEKNGSL